MTMYVNIDLPIERGSLISEIKSLPKITAPPKKKKEIFDEGEPLLLTAVGKKGKKDKGKKKKKNQMGEGLSFMGLNDADVTTEDTYEEYDESDDKLIDIEALLNRDDEEDEVGGIIDEQKRSYEKRKKDENPFKKEFAEELTLLYDLLDDLNKFNKELDKKYKTMESSKVRGVSKYTNDMIINILNAKTSKLQVIKEINSLKKVIADLKIKMDGKKGGAEGGVESTDALATKYFQNILKFGRNNFVKEFGNDDNDGDAITDLVARIEQNKMGYSPDEDESFHDLIQERLESEDNPFRSEAGSKYIQYENLGVKIQIKKCIDNGEWEFVAVDRDNMEVHGYPLPRKRDVGKVKFNDGYATDERGRSYKVIEFYLPDDYED